MYLNNDHLRLAIDSIVYKMESFDLKNPVQKTSYSLLLQLKNDLYYELQKRTKSHL